MQAIKEQMNKALESPVVSSNDYNGVPQDIVMETLTPEIWNMLYNGATV